MLCLLLVSNGPYKRHAQTKHALCPTAKLRPKAADAVAELLRIHAHCIEVERVPPDSECNVALDAIILLLHPVDQFAHAFAHEVRS